MTGHLLGAAGAVESIVCVKAIADGFAPPTAGLEIPGDGCDLNYLPKVGEKRRIRNALSNSFGFGGHNVVLCFSEYRG
jgi:3-oxoacyl-[acyl-carrier-protein] synthase II